MFVDFDRYVKYLGDHKMTPAQFAFCWMLHFRDMKNFNLYQEKVGPFYAEEIEDLIERDYVLNTFPGSDNFRMASLSVTGKFADEILIMDEMEALDELIAVYPKYFFIERKRIFTTACDLDTLARVYARIINKDKILHKMIVERTKKAADMMERGEVTHMKIDKYIKGRVWKSIPTDEDLADDDLIDIRG